MRTFAGKPRNLEDHHGEGSAETVRQPEITGSVLSAVYRESTHC